MGGVCAFGFHISTTSCKFARGNPSVNSWGIPFSIPSFHTSFLESSFRFSLSVHQNSWAIFFTSPFFHKRFFEGFGGGSHFPLSCLLLYLSIIMILVWLSSEFTPTLLPQRISPHNSLVFLSSTFALEFSDMHPPSSSRLTYKGRGRVFPTCSTSFTLSASSSGSNSLILP